MAKVSRCENQFSYWYTCRFVDREELEDALEQLDIITTPEHRERLFSSLVSDGNDKLDLEAFMVLGRKTEQSMYIIDFIPLEEVQVIQEHKLEYARIVCSSLFTAFLFIFLPFFSSSSSGGSRARTRVRARVRTRLPPVLDCLLQAVESCETVDEQTTQLSILTIENGKNRGRVYVYDLPSTEGQIWLEQLNVTVKKVKLDVHACALSALLGPYSSQRDHLS